MNENPTHSRPKNCVDLCDRLARGETCEVRSEDAETAKAMLNGWLEFNAFTALPSDIAGWVLFVPYVENLQQERPDRSTCGVRSRDEEPDRQYRQPPSAFAGCAVVVVLAVLAGVVIWAWIRGVS